MVEHLEDGTSPEIVVKNDDEIKDLADSFSKMYREIGEYIAKLEAVTAEKERIGAELDVAAKIQTSMLPCIFPPFPNRDEFDIYATMNPAKEVGGDFYDFYVKAGFVLAGMEGIRYRSGSVQLQPGDKFFQYSDGVPEAMNSKNEQYGMLRLEKVLAQNSEKTPAELLPAIKADLDSFVGDADQFDDITMLCIEFSGKDKRTDISVTPDKESIKTVK